MAEEAPKKRSRRRPKPPGEDVSIEQDDASTMPIEKPSVGGTTPKKTPTKRIRRQEGAVPASVHAMAGKFVEWASDLGIEGLSNLFKTELLPSTPAKGPTPSYDANEKKNRYKDIPCMEETRVKLAKERPEDGDYIHANWIKFKDHDRTYIATQGPMENTIEDFWRMVWQEQSPIVVNLTKCCEDGKAKCAQYWPEEKEGAYANYGRFTITMKKFDVEEKDKMFIYVLEVLPEGCSNSLIVRVLHTVAWPDGLTLHSTSAMLRLIKAIFKVDTLAKGPVVIHCSAGIGRTGCLVLVDYLLYRLFKSKPANLVEAFLQLRAQRASSIQKEGQFVFIVVTIMAYIGHRIPDYEKQWRAIEDGFKAKHMNA